MIGPARPFSLLLLTFTFTSTLACSGGSSDEIKIDDLCAEDGAFVELVDKLIDCNPEFALFLGAAPTDLDVSNACNAQFAPFIEDKTMVFAEKSLLEECLAAIRAEDCETLELDNIAECEGLILGLVDDGGACDTNGQCGLDSYCDQSGTRADCGICAAKLSDGETCESNNDCANGKCRESKTCSSFALAGDSCEVTDDCVGRLVCRDEVCKVEVAAQAGESCDEFAQCGFPLSNMYCDQAAQECKEFLALDAPCVTDVQSLGVCQLLDYQTCDQESRKCTAPTIVGLGDACSFATGDKCAIGLLCDAGENGRCVEPGLGAACDASKDDDVCGLFLECKENNVCGYEVEYTGMCPVEL